MLYNSLTNGIHRRQQIANCLQRHLLLRIVFEPGSPGEVPARLDTFLVGIADE